MSDLASYPPAQIPVPADRKHVAESAKFRFASTGGKDVYNIAAPFRIAGGPRIIAGRVESRDTELSEIRFFTEVEGTWHPVEGAPVLASLQDPCITFIDGELILGGVRFPITTDSGETVWRMEFYRGSSIDNLELFLTGPDRMKDIRLAPLDDGKIAVLTRPQGEKGGRGVIGFFIAENLATITAEAIERAPLFHGQCPPEQWVGANEAQLLPNGMLGVLGHIACFDDDNGDRHYYPMVFAIDLGTGKATQPEVIGSRADFPEGPAKRPDLVDVIFSGGLKRHEDGTATLYAGLSDAEAGWIRIPDPFLTYL